MKLRSTAIFILLIFFYGIFSSSCIQTRKLTYFNNLADSVNISLNKIDFPKQLIQINDLLEVKIGGENEKTVEYMNQYLGAGSGNGLEKIVDIDGNIELPKIGKLNVAGKSCEDVQVMVTKAYAEFLQNPQVTVRNINFKFAALGEVHNPGNYTILFDKINIFQALAQAGDMTEYALRDKVKIIRETNGNREIISLDFTDKNILNSPYYYIHRNDIIYVPPAGGKASSENFTRTATILATITSLTAFLITIFKK